MKNRVCDAFDQIHAEDALKQKTMKSVLKNIERRERRMFVRRKCAYALSAFMLLLCVGLGSHQLYFTEVFALSVDVNPSIELGINRFDKVISVNGYNEDGEEIVSYVEVKNMNYIDAVDCMVEEERRRGYLVENDEVSITVDCPRDEQYQEIEDSISTCKIQEEQQVLVAKCQNETVSTAHENGLSFGKYRAFLQLQEVKPEVTVDEVKTMTMKEIKTITDETTNHSANTEAAQQSSDHSSDSISSTGEETNANTSADTSTSSTSKSDSASGTNSAAGSSSTAGSSSSSAGSSSASGSNSSNAGSSSASGSNSSNAGSSSASGSNSSNAGSSSASGSNPSNNGSSSTAGANPSNNGSSSTAGTNPSNNDSGSTAGANSSDVGETVTSGESGDKTKVESNKGMTGSEKNNISTNTNNEKDAKTDTSVTPDANKDVISEESQE